MASFKNMIQTFVALFINLWTLFTHFSVSVLRYFRPRSATPVLPLTLTPHVPLSNRQGRLINMSRFLPKAVPSTSALLDFFRAEEAAGLVRSARVYPSTNGIVAYGPHKPFAIARKPLAKDPILIGPLPSFNSVSDMSVYSTSSGSLPATPSLPSSPVMPVQIVTLERNSRFARNLNAFTTSLHETPFKVITTETPSTNGSTTLSNGGCDTLPADMHPEIQDNRFSATSLPCVVDDNEFDEILVHDILPNSFGSNSSSINCIPESIDKLEEFDWPIPPGPLFRFKDEISAAADLAESVFQQRMQLPILPLRIVKRNITPPPCMHVYRGPSILTSELSEYVTETSTAEADESDCSTDSHPFLDISAPHLYSEGIITDTYSRNERSHKLTDILSTLPKEELLNISNLPSGTVVSVENDEGKDGYQLQYNETPLDVCYASEPSTPSTLSTPSTPRSPTRPLPPFLQRKADKHSGPIDDKTITMLEVEYKRWKTCFVNSDPRFSFMDEDPKENDHWSDAFLDAYS